jgi:hypothetical protein
MGLENLKYLWDDLTSGAEYDTEGLYDEPNAPANDHWFKDYALPVGLNALMAFPQGLKDMFYDAPREVLGGHPIEAFKEYTYPGYGFIEGYKDQYQFPFNPDLDPEFDVSAKRLTPFPGVEGMYQLPWNKWQLPSIDDISIKMINSGKPLISDLGMAMLEQGAGTTNLSDYTNIPGNIAAQFLGGRGLMGLTGRLGGPSMQWLASKVYPWTTQGKLPSVSKDILPWGAPPTGIWQNIKNLYNLAGAPNTQTMKQWAINAGGPLAVHGVVGDSDSGFIPDVGASEIPDSSYAAGRMPTPTRRKVIRSQDEQRGPGPWNEFEG